MTLASLPARRPDADRYGVLFVCLGNICRSPMAEGIFIHLAKQRGIFDRLDVDSCGLGDWHVGGPADKRTIAACQRQGVCVPSIARLWDPANDPARFDVIVPMDSQNYRGLLSRGAPRERIRMMRMFENVAAPAASTEKSAATSGSHRLAPRAEHVGGTSLLFPDAAAIPDVPDPYTGPDSGFDELYTMLLSSCRGLVQQVERALAPAR